MGRAGRYPLSVMAWVAAYAGWSSIIGLVVAALTGDRPRNVSPGVSALLTVVGPLVPTLVALWFNDWARDGFPTREQQRAARAGGAARPAQDGAHDERDVAADPVVGGAGARDDAAPPADRPVAHEPVAPPEPGPAVAGQLAVPAAARVTPAPQPPTVAAHPLGVPGGPAANVPAGAFPVAPLLRDRD